MSLAPQITPDESRKTPPPSPSTSALSVAVCWSLVAAFGGGLACGWCIDHFGEFGALSLAGCGALAGYVSHKITRGPSKVAGITQLIATCLAFFVAETCWIHWNMPDGEPSWWVAISLWPRFLRGWQLSALIGATCAAYGAWCAYGYATSPAARPARSTLPDAPPP